MWTESESLIGHKHKPNTSCIVLTFFDKPLYTMHSTVHEGLISSNSKVSPVDISDKREDKLQV